MGGEGLRAAVGLFFGHQFEVVAVAAADHFADHVVRVGGNGGESHVLCGRAFNPDLLIDNLQVVWTRFQLAGGHFENLVARVDGGTPRRGAGNKDAAATDGACVPWTRVGVDVDHSDVAHRNAELLGDNHRNTETGDGTHVDLANVYRR